jgi:hypothetical protein
VGYGNCERGEEMPLQQISSHDRASLRGLNYKGMVEIREDPKSGEIVLIMSEGMSKKWVVFNLPEGMWMARCSKDEVIDVIFDFLTQRIFTD